MATTQILEICYVLILILLIICNIVLWKKGFKRGQQGKQLSAFMHYLLICTFPIYIFAYNKGMNEYILNKLKEDKSKTKDVD
ncbi:hypothetical protein [Candidatus Phytoplasma fraxini]|uniref:hypothetical protein n=1 Tax=Ash yellows phytoplasma TaxID=35780 RepID=UPI0030FE02FA